MKGLSTDVYSHLSLETEVRTSNSVVRLSRATGISSYADLVKAVAKIQFGNPEYSLFFRGQDKDYTLDSGSSTMYPSIYRKSGLSVDELREQMNKLDYAANLLLKEFRANNLLGYNRLADFIELCWAVLQHYEVCETPLLDLTSSLQAAASFALRHKTATGYLFVLGFPHVNGSISYYVEEALINIKLLSICPPDAQRPYFQEGFLVGTFPTVVKKKHTNLDVASRMIAKFRLAWGEEDFWKEGYTSIPITALFPSNDDVKIICAGIKKEIDSKPKDFWKKRPLPEQI